VSIGLDIPRVDGLSKLRGTAKYVDDLQPDGMLHGATVRSTIPRGRIRRIHFDASINWKDLVVVDHRDIKGVNEIQLIDHDQPALVASEVRHQQEPILLLAHRSLDTLRRAVRAIRIEYDPLPAVTNVFQKLTPQLIQYGDDNVFKRIDIRKGDSDVSAVFARAAHVVEGVYETGSQEHVYLETQGMIASREDGKLVIRGTMQCPFYVLKSLTHFFNQPDDAFRVIQTPTGGGFGGKEDYPSHIAIHAALLAEKAGAPVKLVYDRQEDMAATTKRHPSWVKHRTALDREGKLLAMDCEVLLDGGAYCTLSPVVLSRGCIHAGGPYRCDHVRAHGEARLTNTPPNGAFRGFGAPQTIFAIERHMDFIAHTIGIDPIELRKKNFLRDGDTTITGQVIKDGVDMSAMLERAMELSSYRAKESQHMQFNATHAYLRRGIGLASFLHGAGFTGSGETMLKSEAWVEGLPDGRVEVLAANTDMGQGTQTILAQIAADRLGVSEDQIVISFPDTSRVPNSGPTVASRTVMVVGRLIERACDELLEKAGPGRSPAERCRSWHQKNPGQRLIGRAKYSKPESIQWDDKTYKGDAYAAYSWAVYIAEVEVDLRTYSPRLTDFVALQEVGKVIHPTLARGQIQGGVVQGIGWALCEEVVMSDGVMKNAQLTNYIIPTSADLPPIRVYFEEKPSDFGPRGAKGIGELPMDGPAPAVVNAVCAAMNHPMFNAIPLTPERLMNGMNAKAPRRQDAKIES
jgi:CO/xanthine dehydrogenase Mo-binding subunit